ncbi:MAG: Holliday junction branch migration protein RuvA [Candidatus Omnitrophota bacterium]|nr:Holliday junction branch migration protein RuvA [Candidatus Omnitrophota bacterium]
MISRISGKIQAKKEGALIIENGGVSYEVLVPLAVMKVLEKETGLQDQVELVTYYYFQMSQSTAIPILIGFQNDVEKEFFEKFISVSGIGPKAACRALAEPFSSIAGAIDSGDASFLRRLPGIGQQRAREIVAKLQGKVGKYGLIQDGFVSKIEEYEDIQNEALEILLQLQYKRNEAGDMIRKALERCPDVKTSEEILNEVYREKKAV